MKNLFEVGDLVSHKKRGYSGVVIEVILQNHLSYKRAPMYKISWEHGEWMYEIEEQIKLEVKARNV